MNDPDIPVPAPPCFSSFFLSFCFARSPRARRQVLPEFMVLKIEDKIRAERQWNI
jgi:hypothetical protein